MFYTDHVLELVYIVFDDWFECNTLHLIKLNSDHCYL